MTERDLVVVGGGIAGLVIAHDAARAGLSVELLEAGDRTGGMLRGVALGPVTVDVGAESFATRTSGVTDLIADAGLPLRTVAPAPAGAHLAFGSTARDAAVDRAPLPRRTVLGIPADPLADDVVRIIGPEAARRAAAERELPPPAGPEQSLAELVAGRCGPVLAQRLVDTLCRSVYSVPASAARLSRLHPELWRAFTAHGSLLDAAAAVAGAPRAGSAVAGIDGGMWQLADEVRTAAVRHGAVIRIGTPVTALAAHRVTTAAGATVRAGRVVLAVGSGAARALLAPAGSAPASAAADRVRVIAALVHAPGLDAQPVGSGVIASGDTPSAAKALTHVTAKWPWAAQAVARAGLPAGHHVVRLSARDVDAPGLGTREEIAGEIALLTGVPVTAADLVAVTDRVWPDAVAAAPVDDERRAQLEHTGIHLAGAAVAGTGLASVIPHARELARRLLSSGDARVTTSTPVSAS